MASFTVAADKPRFFKVILDTTISNKRLMIPPAYSKKHYSNPTTATATTTATLTVVPSGFSWEVELHKSLTGQNRQQPEVWIQGQAWEHFARCHRLENGHFIVFQYEGDSRFSVFVFAINGCEIRYPSGDGGVVPPKKNRGGFLDPEMVENAAEEYGDDVSVEILGDPAASSGPSRRKNVKKQNERTEKNRGGFLDSKTEENVEENAEEQGDDISLESLSDSDVEPSTRRSPTKQSREKTNSQLNPRFRTVMRDTYLRKNRMGIRTEFAREYLKWKEQTLKLQLADSTSTNMNKKHWFVEAVKVKGRDQMFMGRGDLLSFVKDNRLQLGDSCYFELMDVDDVLLVLQVSISRSGRM
ncbi:B3 domain-containing transcription factor VRN1 [Linum grandiflorum]